MLHLGRTQGEGGGGGFQAALVKCVAAKFYTDDKKRKENKLEETEIMSKISGMGEVAAWPVRPDAKRKWQVRICFIFYLS